MDASALINLNYNGHQIPVNRDSNGIFWFSLTEMASRFETEAKDWLRLEGTREYLNAVREAYLSNSHSADLPNENFDVVRVLRGGRTPGTWGTSEVAMSFARWLNPAFAVWCDRQILELMSKGSVHLTKDKIIEEKILTIIHMANKGQKFGYQLQKALAYTKGDKSQCKTLLSRVFSGMRGDFDTKDRLFKLTYDNLNQFHAENGKAMGNEKSSEFFWVIEHALREWKNFRGRSIGQSGTTRNRTLDPLPISKIAHGTLE